MKIVDTGGVLVGRKKQRASNQRLSLDAIFVFLLLTLSLLRRTAATAAMGGGQKKIDNTPKKGTENTQKKRSLPLLSERPFADLAG